MLKVGRGSNGHLIRRVGCGGDADVIACLGIALHDTRLGSREIQECGNPRPIAASDAW
ncbi:MAG: hypothetical protein ACREFT_00310 [Acetobacteraceae bacterium]